MEVDVCVVGAGAVGLAVAEALAGEGREALVVERNERYGAETSSRSSEVIHAGFFNPPNSLKARLCVEGKFLLYEFCERKKIPFKKIGKLLVASSPDEIPRLEFLLKQGNECGVDDLVILDERALKKTEPSVEGCCALLSPSTGIFDTEGFMRRLEESAKSAGAIFSYRTELVGAERTRDGYRLRCKDASGGEVSFTARTVVNSAGLQSDIVSQMVGISNYRLRYCKGDYFSVRGNLRISRLIYPAVEETGAGLGIHATLDIGGRLRLGPDAEYISRDNFSYDVDERKKEKFFKSAKKFLPFVSADDLAPDTAGIRPKLQGPDEDFRDFVVSEESEKGFPGWINLVGIESPGLTAALAIGREVAKLARE